MKWPSAQRQGYPSNSTTEGSSGASGEGAPGLCDAEGLLTPSTGALGHSLSWGTHTREASKRASNGEGFTDSLLLSSSQRMTPEERKKFNQGRASGGQRESYNRKVHE